MPVALGELGQREPALLADPRSRGPTRSRAAAIEVASTCHSGHSTRHSQESATISCPPTVPGSGATAAVQHDRHERTSWSSVAEPHGLSAALVLTRARRRVAVVDAGQPRNAPAAHMHGFLVSRRPAARRAARSRPRRGHRLRRRPGRRHRQHHHVRRPERRPAPRFDVSSRTGDDAARPPGPGHHRAARRAPGHPRRARALGPRPAALPLLPRLRGPRPAARRARRHTRRRSRTRTSSGSGPTTSCSSPTAPPLTADQREQLDRPRHRRRRRARSPAWSSRTTG